jgi:hypothetical protein
MDVGFCVAAQGLAEITAVVIPAMEGSVTVGAEPIEDAVVHAGDLYTDEPGIVSVSQVGVAVWAGVGHGFDPCALPKAFAMTTETIISQKWEPSEAPSRCAATQERTTIVP